MPPAGMGMVSILVLRRIQRLTLASEVSSMSRRMSRKSSCAACITLFLSFVNLGFGQDAVAANAAPVVPNLINFGGVLTDLNARPLAGVQGVTFLLYRTQQGGTPLWMETQNVTPIKNGQYTVVLGSASTHGLPADLFATGEGRWLAVQIAGQPEQPRVMLVAVPYALKAADAQTIGGLPPSAFLRAAPPNVGAPADSSADATGPVSALASSALPPPPQMSRPPADLRAQSPCSPRRATSRIRFSLNPARPPST